MIRMLDDPQLGRQAYLYLCGLLRFHIGAGLSESDRGRYKANVLFGYVHGAPAAERERAIERTLAWWDENQNAIELSRHFSRAVH